MPPLGLLMIIAFPILFFRIAYAERLSPLPWAAASALFLVVGWRVFPDLLMSALISQALLFAAMTAWNMKRGSRW